MRVGFDGKNVVNNEESGNRGRDIIVSLADSYPDSDFLVYSPKFKENIAATLKEIHNIRICLPAASGFKGELWRKFGITNNLPADKVDIYHGMDGQLPLNIKEAGIPSFLTIRNLEWMERPERFSSIKRKLNDYICRKSCINATYIIVPDEKIKMSVSNFYVISPDKIIILDESLPGRVYSDKIMELYKECIS